MATYRGYEITEQVGRLGLTDEPGIWRVSIGTGFEGPREIVERFIDKEIAIAEFRAAHKRLMPWEAEEYGVALNQKLLASYEAAEAAFVAVHRPWWEGQQHA